MNKGKDIDEQLAKYLSPDLYCYVHNYIVDLKRQLDQLTNNWNELEKFVKNKMLYAFKNEIGYYKEILDKMEEIKEGKNEKRYED